MRTNVLVLFGLHIVLKGAPVLRPAFALALVQGPDATKEVEEFTLIIDTYSKCVDLMLINFSSEIMFGQVDQQKVSDRE